MMRAMNGHSSPKITDRDPRHAAAVEWTVRTLARDDLEISVASADASFRRYLRAEAGGASWIVMDAPPERETCEPFIDVARRLRTAGVNAPEILAADLAQGFLLLSDLGRETFLDVLTDENADGFFPAALDALIAMQANANARGLPPYDAALLQRELDLYPDWYLARHRGVRLDAAERAIWDDACARLIESACAQPQVFVHRDYMPRNLMVSDPLPGVIDFQDAVRGPVTYDLVSLFRDAFVSWPEERVNGWVAEYRRLAAHAGIELPVDFERAFDWMGLQRHLKVIGIFARLHYRDGKEKYLAETPRFFRYVYGIGGKYAEFDNLLELIRRYEEEGRSGKEEE
ncbi:MAG TPA: phosphotransferase [Gammaproteobacteria bacterium]